MNILVTGGAGYAGSVLVGQALAEGHSVRVLDNFLYGGDALLAYRLSDRFSALVGDVRNRRDVERSMADVAVVIHLAALVGESACAVDPAVSRSTNIEGTEIVLQAAAAAGAERVIVASTCSNYGLTADAIAADEDTRLAPLSLYAETKIEAEQTAVGFHGRLAVTVFRFGTLYGLSPRMRFDIIPNGFAHDVASGAPVIINKPRAWRPILHVTDVWKAVRACLERPRISSPRLNYNVVGSNVRKGDLAEEIATTFEGVEISYQDIETDPRSYRVNAQRFTDDYGFMPFTEWKSTLQEMVEAIRQGWFGPDESRHRSLPQPDRLHGRMASV